MHVAIQPRGLITPEALRAALVAALPPGIADVRVHRVDGFPRNHMGKIERGKLAASLAPRP